MTEAEYFRIHMPYGIEKNSNNEWAVFNREYSPIGTDKHGMSDEYIYESYPNITSKLLNSLGCDGQKLPCDSNGEVEKYWFYNDSTNPSCKGATASMKREYIRRVQAVLGFTPDL